MLQQELESLKEKALDIISDYIRKNGKHGYAIITYKDNPECYVGFSMANIPYLQSCNHRINGDMLDNIVKIADAIEEYKNNIDWVIYPQVSVRVKATSMEKAKEKATQYLTDKEIPKELIIISNKDCYKV